MKLGLINKLDDINIQLHHNIQYTTSQLILAVLLGLTSGMNRATKIEGFTLDPLIQTILRLDGSISDSTFKDRFSRFSMNETNQYMNIIGKTSSEIHNKLKTRQDILDIDSTVRTVYGRQEGAEKGFNEVKKGARSYHPLLAFLNSTRECLLSWLRPGNSYTSNNAAGFLEQTFGMLPETIKELLVRADTGFFSESIIEVIEGRKNFQYLIKVKLKNLQKVLSNQEWYSVPGMPDTEICDFDYRPSTWKRSRHFSAIRKFKRLVTEGQIFPYKEYEYFCYCTNIEDNPIQIHRLYGDRGTSENWIENVKNQMFAGDILTKDFWTNEVYWLSSVLAYNISVWMRKLCDEKSWHEEPSTFRNWFVQLAGKLTRGNGYEYLKMYSNYYYKDRWRRIEYAVNNLRFA